jgi:hypothetical protein
MQTESVDILRSELQIIVDWENEQKDLWFWEKLGRLPFALLDRITPKFIQDKMGLAMDELGSYIQTGGQYLINKEKIYHKFYPHEEWNESTFLYSIKSLSLSSMDALANRTIKSSSNIATLQSFFR